MSGSGRFDQSNDPTFRQLGICESCLEKYQGTIKCRAFPEGIPLIILTGDYDHHNAFPGDHGIQYTPVVV